jgi:hypothetical protein
MTPLLVIAPAELPPAAPVATAIVVAGEHHHAGGTLGTISGNFYVTADAHVALISEPDFGGIDYDKWQAVVQPAARSAFADRLDILELIDD